ncbi:MAG: nucleoside deaminase [Clostridia bacterium]|nr:nucleoside deaminase [Clostridia bacterium]
MLSRERYEELIRLSIQEAQLAMERGDDPFGGVITDSEGKVIVSGGNRQNSEKNPTAHAEMVLIREACKKLETTDLSGCISVCNAESCPMCASALVLAGIREFYFGVHMEPFCNPHIRMKDVLKASRGEFTLVDGILEEECADVMRRGRELHALSGTLPLYARDS